ncbi:MAG TPA: 2-oxoglutarate dehydrogenase E1 component [Chloroflexota bacterium]|nr:2-oxoglutarate dehydrogenase E1 component [Chloroflexota bacterium]
MAEGEVAGLWRTFHGPNAAYLLELYERFRTDPLAVDPQTRAAFERWSPALVQALGAPAREAARAEAFGAGDLALVAAAGKLATGIREYGHRAARLDPLGSAPPGDPELEASTHGLKEGDLERLPASAIGGPVAAGAANARQAVERLRRIYCASTGYDYDHVQDAEERVWLRDAAETERYRPPQDPLDERGLLERLSEVGAFERFLHRQFPGRTRFSIEGTGMLIPMLDEIIGAAAESGTRSVLLGMAHRGRLNVLAHVLRKPHREILTELRHPLPPPGVARSDASGQAFSGDVTYHLGARRAIRHGQQVVMAVTLAPNPSHLEFVDPVVEGMARAADERRDRQGPPVQDETSSLPLLIHGDASFPGQGVVAETLNLSRLPGYRTGGTIHIIANNQLGFTVEPKDGRTTLYASDLAKGFEIPIVHVNADDPEACIAAARLAHAYRERFHKDFLIDLIGYRRWGHNEGDDPSLTQPRMYESIARHPTVRELWAGELVRRGVVTEAEVAATLARYTSELQTALNEVQQAERERESGQEAPAAPVPDGPVGAEAAAGGPARAPAVRPVRLEELAALNQTLSALPAGFTAHPRLERFLLRPRREAFEPAPEGGQRTLDWGHAEQLALGTILSDGTPIRLTGQDSGRGTFSQRHAVLHDYRTGETYVPLQHVGTVSFEVRDSPLSETAALGFEYGYSLQAPDALVLWEAQYGDFINGAQVIVDQFIVSARAKWGQQPSLVLLLPHAYEGQGPEHSSARLERFLESAAEDNIRVANCTTAAQYFHLLRRQAASLRVAPRPLVVMTPKSLLRHPLAASSPAALADGAGFRPVLDDPYFEDHPRDGVRRLVLCSGKVYVDLAAAEGRDGTVAIVRLEELYPFPSAELAETLDRYPGVVDVVWLQEEPRNMGAWAFVQPRIQAILARHSLELRYVGRPERASPAEGSPSWHAAEQQRIVSEAFAGLDRLGAPRATVKAAPAAPVASGATRVTS